MLKHRAKLLIWVALLPIAVMVVIGAIVGLGAIVVYVGTGADPAAALQVIPVVPGDTDKRVKWQDDAPAMRALRTMEPPIREQIAGSYLRAWAQWNISYNLRRPYGLATYFSGPALQVATEAVTSTVESGWRIKQSDLHHTLQLSFYSDDGSIVAFSDQEARVIQSLTPPESGAASIVETNSVYDVLMLLEDGNWRVRHLVRRGSATWPTPGVAAQPVAAPSVVDGKLEVGDQLFVVAGVNYYPQATPWTAFWPNYRPAQTRADLARMRALGLNSVRIFVPFSDFGGDTVEPIALQQLVDLLNQANTAQIKVIVTLFDHRTDHALDNWAADDRHLAAIVAPLASHPALLAWDVKNEPDRDYGSNGRELTDAWLKHIVAEVRRYDPHHLVTIGWSSPEAAAALSQIVDVVSYHYYADAADYAAQVLTLRAAAPGKPLLLQEYGLPTWNSIFPNGHTEEEQAVYYAAILRQQRELETAGSLFWTLYDFDTVALAEFRLPWQRGPQANLGVIRRDGELKPAAALVTPGASLDVAPIPGWRRFVKPFWLALMAAVSGGLLMLAILLWLWRRSRRRQQRAQGLNGGE